jgi:hypothetical protein
MYFIRWGKGGFYAYFYIRKQFEKNYCRHCKLHDFYLFIFSVNVCLGGWGRETTNLRRRIHEGKVQQIIHA